MSLESAGYNKSYWAQHGGLHNTPNSAAPPSATPSHRVRGGPHGDPSNENGPPTTGDSEVGLTDRIDLSTMTFDTGMGTGYLTPDALMTYCTYRLKSLDGQIQDAMKKQQASVEEQRLISQLLPELQALQDKGTTQGDGSTGVNYEQCKQLESDIEAVIKQIHDIDPSSPALGQLENLHDKIMANGSGPFDDASGHHPYYGPKPTTKAEEDGCISGPEMQAYVKELESINSTINSSAELTMINVQSLMSQRQTAVQLTTNLVQSLGDQANKIADNIGH
jgi:hypothetical protein